MHPRILLRLPAIILTVATFMLSQSSHAGQQDSKPKPVKYATLVLTEQSAAGDKPDFRTGGIMHYLPAGPTFTYSLHAHGLRPKQRYTLLYLPKPWPGRGLACLGTTTTNRGGSLSLKGSSNLNSDLPARFDENYPTGASIVLALASDVDCLKRKMVRWKPGNYLFGRWLITYHDTDYVLDYSGRYCVITQRPGKTSSFEMQIEQSGTTITATVEGITATGILSGQTATLIGTTPEGTFTMAFTFSDDGTTLSGTLSIETELRSLSGTKGVCWDYVFPSGNPVCTLPVVNPNLVTGGQQFNSVYAGVTHTGVDFKFESPLPAIAAPCDGVVVEINRQAISLGNIIVDVVIKYNDDWTTFIAFEPYSPDPVIAEQQERQIAVTVNQVVYRGDLLGHLVVPDPVTDFPHIHWGINRNDGPRTPVCPRDYMTPEAGAALDELYKKWGLEPVCLP